MLALEKPVLECHMG